MLVRLTLVVFTFSKYHIANKDELRKAKAAFTARILEEPFKVDAGLA